MRARQAIAIAAAMAMALALAGCQSGGLAGNLRGVRTTPNEFLVLPTKPLEMPKDLAAAAAAEAGHREPRRLQSRRATRSPG